MAIIESALDDGFGFLSSIPIEFICTHITAGSELVCGVIFGSSININCFAIEIDVKTVTCSYDSGTPTNCKFYPCRQ